MAAGDPGTRKRNYSATAIETKLLASIAAASQGDTTTGVLVNSISGFPTTFPYTLILDPDTSKEEVVTVTSGSSTTIVLTRGQDNTTAFAHSAGAAVRHGVSAREFKELQTHISARGVDADTALMSGVDTHVHGIVTGEGSVVGTDKIQTLTAKTLTTPTINGATLTGTVTSTASIVISGAGTITGLSSAGMTTSSATPKSYVDAILGSATAASTSATSAATSATSAATSASSAATSATASASSASAAATSASSALTSQTAAATSATSAATSASSALTSQTAATTSATSAATSASSALTSQTAAATSAASAAASATAAAASSATAATSASQAATSATSAATSATSATASATAAATSATSAAASATTASNSAATATTQASNAATSASSALTSQTAAATSATSAAASATAAATSATSAATSATSAAASATTAAGYVPSLTGNSGKYLTTNGTATSWGTVDALPSQTSNSGKYLTTNGTSASWAAVAGSVADPTEPTSPTDGLIWVDTDATAVGNQVVRWSKATANGTTTLSGNDDSSVPLGYVAGYEQVYQNGVLLARGGDYTATNGSTIALTNASVTGDIFEVFASSPVAIVDVYTQTQANSAFIAKTLTTTTGDIIYASGANTPARLGVGSTGQVLTVASGVPSWATPVGGVTFVGASAYNNSGTAAASGTWTVMTFPSENYDTDSIHSTVTNTSRFTIPTGKSGKWLVNFVATFEGNNSNCNVQTAIYKNGTSVKLNRNGQQINSGERDLGVPAILDLVAGDYLEFFVNQDSGISRTFYVTTSQGRAEIAYLGA
jgi:hypothetical protein